MLIQVKYDDEKYDYVKNFMLDKLIETGVISGFRRRSGWVRIGVDPIRKPRNGSYCGAERRDAVA